MNKKTILYVTELIPYPATSGAKIKSINTLQTLSIEFNIILLCFKKNTVSNEDLSQIKKFTKHAWVITIPDLNEAPKKNWVKLLKNYLKFNPHLIYQFYSKEANKLLSRIIKKFNPEIIHIDHLSMVQYLPESKNQKWIFEEHNVEHQLALTKLINFKKIKLTKVLLFIEYLFIYLHEKLSYKKFDHIFAISNHDESSLKKIFKLDNISTQKLFYPSIKTSRIKNKNNDILFIGDITWPPNILAVKWFSKTVFPLIRSKLSNSRFIVIGKIDDVFANEINRLKGASALGFKKNIEHYLKKSKIFVLPFESGGGVRIKALTAFSSNLPVVSTTLGVQGINGKLYRDYLVADKPIKFAALCLLLLTNKNINNAIGKNGNTYLKKNHSMNNNLTFLRRYKKIIQ